MKTSSKRFTLAMAALSLVMAACDNPAAAPVSPSVDAAITLLAIPGVTAPVKGASPVTTTTETDQYTGTVSWSPEAAPAFAAVTEYTATITLTAKAGYTLAGVAADSFTVAGATVVSHGADSGVITAAFPATLSFALTILTVPAGRFQRDATPGNVSVITRPYGMSACEITRAQFEEVLGEDPTYLQFTSSTNDPVQYMSWSHAIAFCNKLSLAEGLDPVYAVDGVDFITLTYGQIPVFSTDAWKNVTATWTNDGYRLPTEMEWMWAAMGAPADGSNINQDSLRHLEGENYAILERI